MSLLCKEFEKLVSKYFLKFYFVGCEFESKYNVIYIMILYASIYIF